MHVKYAFCNPNESKGLISQIQYFIFISFLSDEKFLLYQMYRNNFSFYKYKGKSSRLNK